VRTRLPDWSTGNVRAVKIQGSAFRVKETHRHVKTVASSVAKNRRSDAAARRDKQEARDTMRPNTLIDSIRWRPERSIAEDIQWAVGWAAFTAIAAPLFVVAVYVAVMK
jgi:hypothetical protein